MRIEEITLRQEIRQMLNEAGFNRNTLKDEVKSILREEIKKAIKQAVNETDFNDYIKREADQIIKDDTKVYLQDTITRYVVGGLFYNMKVSVDITDINGESIISPKDEE